MSRATSLIPRSIASHVKIARTRLFEAAGSGRYTWPALNQLDRKVLEHLESTPGVFLEIGGNDGYSQSNTYHLERVCGWRGILIEPIPRLYKRCRRHRTNSKCFNTACIAPGGPATIEIEDSNLTSVVLGIQDTTDEARRSGRGHVRSVRTSTLSRVIDQAGETSIDFMSIDVEGAEFAVLAGLELERHCPGLLLIETDYPDRVASFLSPRMALLDTLSHHDYLFTRVR